jgi:heterodisulfide reductase subunit C
LVLRAEYPREDEEKKREESAEICLKCGVCCVLKVHSCHAQYDEQFNPLHTFVYDCLESENPTSNQNIWLCVSCHKCEELCPYDVTPFQYIEAIKARAFELGIAHPGVVSEIEQIVVTGFAFPVTGSSGRQREALDLEPLELKAQDELKCISERTGLAERLKRYKEAQE